MNIIPESFSERRIGYKLFTLVNYSYYNNNCDTLQIVKCTLTEALTKNYM